MRESSFRDFVLDQLRALGRVTSRAMFGAHGLYHGDIFFAIITSKDRLFFRTDKESVREYRARGMKPFRFGPGQSSKSYYEVPPDVLEDPTALVAWARRAVAAQQARRRP